MFAHVWGTVLLTAAAPATVTRMITVVVLAMVTMPTFCVVPVSTRYAVPIGPTIDADAVTGSENVIVPPVKVAPANVQVAKNVTLRPTFQ